MLFSLIAVKLRLVMSKTNKKKKNKMENQKDLLANIIFLKVFVIYDAFGANHFIL